MNFKKIIKFINKKKLKRIIYLIIINFNLFNIILKFYTKNFKNINIKNFLMLFQQS